VPLEAFLSRKHTWRKSLAGNIRPNEGMVTSILHNRDKLVAFQAMVRSSLSNVQDSIQYLGKELEDSSRWSQPDVEFCGSLWANLNTVCCLPTHSLSLSLSLSLSHSLTHESIPSRDSLSTRRSSALMAG